MLGLAEALEFELSVVLVMELEIVIVEYFY